MNNENNTTLEITSKVNPLIVTEEKVKDTILKLNGKPKNKNFDYAISSKTNFWINKTISSNMQGRIEEKPMTKKLIKDLELTGTNEDIRQDGLVTIKEGKNDYITVVFRGALGNLTRKEFDELIEQKLDITGDLNLFTAKLKTLYDIQAFKQLSKYYKTDYQFNGINSNDLIITIPTSEIAKELHCSKKTVSKNIGIALIKLRSLYVEKGKVKKKMNKKYTIETLDDMELYQDKKLYKENKEIKNSKQFAQLTLSIKYAYHILGWGYVQVPKEILSYENLQAFELMDYISYLLRTEEPTTDITRRTLLNNMPSIPTFEKVAKEEKYKRDYKTYIYNPFEKAIEYINKNSKIIYIDDKEVEKIDVTDSRGNTDKEKWQNVKLNIIVKEMPNYDQQHQTKQLADKKAEKEIKKKRKTKKQNAEEVQK